MSKVNICDVVVLNNPSSFNDPFKFEITFKCYETINGQIEFKLIYIGSPESDEYYQELDRFWVRSVLPGLYTFVFEARAPDPAKIPLHEIIGVSTVMLTCSYRNNEFIKIGYSVLNEIVDQELKENPPAELKYDLLRRLIDVQNPRVTKIPIKWDVEIDLKMENFEECTVKNDRETNGEARTIVMQKPTMTRCLICKQENTTEFTLDHLSQHFGLDSLKCGVVNCSSEFQNEFQLDLHFKMKHAASTKKAKFLTTTSVFNGIANEIKTIMHSNQKNDSQIFNCLFRNKKFFGNLVHQQEVSRFLVPKKKFQNNNSDTQLGEQNRDIATVTCECFGKSIRVHKCSKIRKVQCLQCSKLIIPLTSYYEEHALYHLKVEKQIDWVYRCSLCRAGPCKSKQFLEYSNLHQHFRHVHKNVKSQTKINYVDRRNEFKQMVVEKLKMCFGARIQSKYLKLKEKSCRKTKDDMVSSVNTSIKTNICSVKCLKCGIKVDNLEPEKVCHCLLHLPRRKDVFVCLLCKARKRTSRLLVIKKHLVTRHCISLNDIQVDVHYKNQIEKTQNSIKSELNECFNKIAPVELNRRNQMRPMNENTRTCALCNNTYKSVPSCFRHTGCHLETETKIEWLFSCLLCKKSGNTFKALQHDAIRYHLLSKHSEKPAINVNYLDKSNKFENELNSLRKKCFPLLHVGL